MSNYTGIPDFQHGRAPKLGVLVVNLGTPSDTSVGAVRRYLKQFLSDPRVIELPRWLWMLILHLVILRIRPRRSADAYRKIWTAQGSPLKTLSESLAAKIGALLDERYDGRALVELGMTYGQPSIAGALARLRNQGATALCVLPLYPQYSATTTGSVFDQVAEFLRGERRVPEFSLLTQYHDEPRYVEAVAESIRRYRDEHGSAERLLFSFHGIPKRYLTNGDPYHCQCRKTARLVAERLGLDESGWFVSFQSRVGRQEWLRPYTDETVEQWGAAGVGRVDVVCPGFSIDCLETLEEIAIQNREIFEQAGGGELRYIPCLNDADEHAALLAELIAVRLDVMSAAQPGGERELRQSRERALASGAER